MQVVQEAKPGLSTLLLANKEASLRAEPDSLGGLHEVQIHGAWIAGTSHTPKPPPSFLPLPVRRDAVHTAGKGAGEGARVSRGPHSLPGTIFGALYT